jgi:adenine-specific DNA methylase
VDGDALQEEKQRLASFVKEKWDCASWLVTQESERSGTRLQWSFDILYLDLPTFRPTYVQAYHLLPEELKGIPLRDWNAPCFLKLGG